MTVKRTKEPWMDAADYGRSLPKGVGVNLLVEDVVPMVAFLRDVLEARVLDHDEDFAALIVAGSPMMLHADHTYDDHPLSGIVAGAETRGAGVEIRVYGLDPDLAESRARKADHFVLAGSLDKPHGLRECFIVSPAGYVFVVGTAI